MTYNPTRRGERGKGTELYRNEPTGYSRKGRNPQTGSPLRIRTALGMLPGSSFPAFPGFLPGPPQRFEGAPTPTMPTSIFPTHTRVGDQVTISGPFGTFAQGQVRVKFEGTGWLSPQLLGPATASVIVPQGARNGLCEVEINGRRVFGTNCIVDAGTVKMGRHGGVYGSPSAWLGSADGLGADDGPGVVTVALVVFGAFAVLALASAAIK